MQLGNRIKFLEYSYGNTKRTKKKKNKKRKINQAKLPPHQKETNEQKENKRRAKKSPDALVRSWEKLYYIVACDSRD